ncbi:SDR family oxidoreductase [Tropicibacter naphthalenivorans]|uniref:Putative ketoacyl reductase n=1 Tax=Tropicibacter naphthalenivorans TaxID=441103 RepID=A0A0N7M066_9RHOB|nr:SDR family oxidoreductase [Tropicibacter naphthalenivorans]CUH79609.1 Putative ketoacyl reductase [Tropicibacter naphthalenivorans]SMC73731.1 Short-chain dehydrogenase [Tropicibacter naphthalenivorans]
MMDARTAIVTGGGQGIGRAIARALAGQGVRVCVVDLDLGNAHTVASEIGGAALACDLRDPAGIETMIAAAEAALGEIDMLVSNAGFAGGAVEGPTSAPDAQWQDSWDLHVMAHLRASRLVLPGMIARGRGWLVNVASAAGLLSQIGDAPYSATKHAAVSLAQSLAIEHGDQGIHVSVVCPLYVATPLLGYDIDAPEGLPNDRVLTAKDVADALMDGLHKDRFLILPHPEAAIFARRRAEDMDRWIAGMRRLRREAFADGVPQTLADLHRKI